MMILEITLTFGETADFSKNEQVKYTIASKSRLRMFLSTPIIIFIGKTSTRRNIIVAKHEAW